MSDSTATSDGIKIVKDMALTDNSFFRGLPAAMGDIPYRVEGPVVIGGVDSRHVEISIKPLPTRILGGLMKIERSEITILFKGFDEGEREAFMAGFDRAYQRAGG